MPQPLKPCIRKKLNQMNTISSQVFCKALKRESFSNDFQIHVRWGVSPLLDQVEILSKRPAS